MGKGTTKSREEREKEREREEAKAEKNATSAKGTASASGSATQTGTQKKERDAYLTEKAATSAKGTGISIAQTSAQKKEKTAYLTEKNAMSAKGSHASGGGTTTRQKSAHTDFYIPPVIGQNLPGNEKIKPLLEKAVVNRTFGDLSASLMDFYQSADHFQKTKALAGKNIITDMQAINTPEGAEADMKRKEARFYSQLDKGFRTLAEQKIADDPINRFWEHPILSANEQPFYISAVDTGLENQLKRICELTGYDYNETLDHYIRVTNAEQTGQRNAAMAGMAEEKPGLMSAISIMMMPTDVVGAIYGAANSAAGRPIDVNSPAYMGTNSRMAARGRVKKDLEESYGAAVGVGYDIAMSFLDAAYGVAVVGGGKIADGMEAASSAVNTYISLINSGVSPEIAGVQAGLQVGLDLVDLTGVGDEVLGAALKKAGLDELLLHAVKPGSAADEVLEAVDARQYLALIGVGLEYEGRDLTAAKWKEMTDRVAKESGITTEELGKVLRLTYQDGNAITGNNRRTWRQSEMVAEMLFPDYLPQHSFMDRIDSSPRKKGSVKPDLYGNGRSIEVKNYNLSSEKNTYEMVRVVENQYFQRDIHLPSGTKQIVLIDVLGQDVSEERCVDIIQKIHKRTDGNMLVWFMSN